MPLASSQRLLYLSMHFHFFPLEKRLHSAWMLEYKLFNESRWDIFYTARSFRLGSENQSNALFDGMHPGCSVASGDYHRAPTAFNNAKLA